MTRKRRCSALIWWNHMRLPQARPCSSTTGGPAPTSLTATPRLPTWFLSMEKGILSFPRPAYARAASYGGFESAEARRRKAGRRLRRHGAQEFFEFAAQLGGRGFDLFGGGEHGFRGAAGLGDAAGDLVERRRDRLGTGRGAGDVVGNFAGRRFLLLDRAGDRRGVLIDVVHPLGDVADRRHRAGRRALHR